MDKAFIIGSISQEEDIKKIAELWRKRGFNVKHVKKEPNVSIRVLIVEAFDNIKMSDIIIAVTKPDGTLGSGTTYECVFAEYIGKRVLYENPKLG